MRNRPTKTWRRYRAIPPKRTVTPPRATSALRIDTGIDRGIAIAPGRTLGSPPLTRERRERRRPCTVKPLATISPPPTNANAMLPSSVALLRDTSPLGGKTKVKNPQSECIEFGGLAFPVHFEGETRETGGSAALTEATSELPPGQVRGKRWVLYAALGVPK